MNKRLFTIVILLVIILSGCYSSKNELEEKTTLNESNKMKNVEDFEQDNISGKNTSNNNNSTSSKSLGENNIEELDSNDAEDASNQLYSLSIGEITDPNILNQLWQTYFYEAIPTLLNSRNFSNPSEIRLDDVVAFAACKYEKEKGIEHLEIMEGSRARIIPFIKIEPYIKQYFNIEKIDYQELSEHLRTDDSKSLLNSLILDEQIDDYTKENHWGFLLEDVYYHEDHRITANLVKYDDLYKDKISVIHSLTLKFSEFTNSFYFASGTYEEIDNNMVQFNGDHVDVDSLKEYAQARTNLKVIGEIDDKIILYSDYYPEEKNNRLITIDSNNYQLIKELELGVNYKEINMVKYHDNNIVVEKDDMISIYNDDLELIREILLPELIQQITLPDLAIKVREENFNYYDISSDYSRLVYADEEGLKLYSIDTGIEELITEPINRKKGILSPRFIGKDNNIVATIPGAMASNGFIFYSTIHKKLDIHNIFSGYMYFFNSYIGDQSILSVMFSDKKTDSLVRGYIVFDMNAGGYRILDFKDIWENGLTTHAIDGINEAAFIEYLNDDSRTNVIHKYNFENTTFDKVQLTITEADSDMKYNLDLDIIGVLEDGRVLIKYHYNSKENGIIVTK